MHWVPLCFVLIHFCQLAVSDEMMNYNRMEQLFGFIWKTYENWPSLQNAVKPSSPVQQAHSLELALASDTEEFLKKPAVVDKKEVAAWLGDRIEKQLHTKIQDETLEQVAGKLLKYLDVVKDPKQMHWHEFMSRLVSIDNEPLKNFG